MRKDNFWPIVLIAVGAMVLFGSVFSIALPFIRLLVVVLIVWVGVQLVTGRFGGNSEDDEWETDEEAEQGTRFSGVSEVTEKKNKRTYNFIFSSNHLDLTGDTYLPSKIELNNIFGSTVIRLPVDYNVSLKASGAFCSVSMPDKQSFVIGENAGRYGSQDPSAPVLKVDINCVFGSVKCIVG